MGMVAMGWQLDEVISVIFSNLNGLCASMKARSKVEWSPFLWPKIDIN